MKKFFLLLLVPSAACAIIPVSQTTQKTSQQTPTIPCVPGDTRQECQGSEIFTGGEFRGFVSTTTNPKQTFAIILRQIKQ